MTAQRTPDALSTVRLGELRLTIEVYDRNRPHRNDHAAIWAEFYRMRAEAWKAAFEWLFRVPLGSDDYDEGMRLIREKLL